MKKKKVLIISLVILVCIGVATVAWSIVGRLYYISPDSPVIWANYTGTDGRALYGMAHIFDTGRIGEAVGVLGESRDPDGYGVSGNNGATSGAAVAVRGTSLTSPNGIGVHAEGNSYGVYGESTGTTGMNIGVYGKGRTYGVLSDGNFTVMNGNSYVYGNSMVTGNFMVSGILVDSSRINIARYASVAVSSSYNETTYGPRNAIDTIIAWDVGEWATNGELERQRRTEAIERGDVDPGYGWIQLSFTREGDRGATVPVPVKCSKILIFSRPNSVDGIDDAWLLILHRGEVEPSVNLHLGQFPSGGAPKEVRLTRDQGTDVIGLKVVITQPAQGALNPGFAEIEIYHDPLLWESLF